MNKFDVDDYIILKELVKEKLEEIEGNDHYEGSKKILESTLEKLNDCLEE